MSDEDNLMPRIVVDKKAKEYVETDEEEAIEEVNEVEEIKEEIELPRIVKDLPVSRKKKYKLN